MSVELWVEKYRPQSLDEYVWKDQAQRQKVEQWVREGALPHLLLSGVSGTGKTSLAKLLMRLLGIPAGDVLTIYASRERKIDEVQDRVVNFAQTWALNDTGFKYVIMDEVDALSILTQKFLRSEMETYEKSCRFILTCNYPEKIMPAVRGRCQEMKFAALDHNDFIARVGEILVTEDVSFEVEDLLGYVEMSYPDLRKTIGMVQQYTNVTPNEDGTFKRVLLPPPSQEEQTNGKDYLIDMAGMFKRGQYSQARQMIVEQAQVEEYPDIYRYFYKNLGLWGNSTDQQDDALLVIRRAIVNHALVADPEINLAACLVELSRIAKS